VVGALRRLAGEERAAGLALAVVALLYPLHGLVDYDWDFVAVSAPFFFTLGVLLTAGTPTRVVRRPFIAFAGALVALAAISSLVSPWLADRRVNSSNDALESNRTAAAIERADEARSLDPLSVDPLFAEALAKEREGKVLDALRLYVRATEMQPENAETWYQLGAFELGLHSYGWAELHLTRARELDPHGPATQALKDLRAERAGRG
jgi:tetratricopeptide (TPR) repeat protein